jgi:hypothetical protein
MDGFGSFRCAWLLTSQAGGWQCDDLRIKLAWFVIIVDDEPKCAIMCRDKFTQGTQWSHISHRAQLDFNGDQSGFTFKNQIDLRAASCAEVVGLHARPEVFKAAQRGFYHHVCP